MSTLFKLLGIGAALYIALLAFLYFFQRSLIYHPDTTRPVPAHWGVADMSAVTLTATDGQSLLAWWKPPESAEQPVLVFFHGNAGHIGYRGTKIRSYLDSGFGVLLLSWRGYSGNDGKPSEAGLYLDGKAALSFLDAQGVPEEKRVFYGESLGSGVAVELASRGHGGALVLEAPFTSLSAVAASHYPIFPVRWLIWDHFDSVKKIGGIALPILLIHGERDRVVPVKFGRKLLEAANQPKQGIFVPQASHNDLYSYGVASAVRRYLVRKYGGKP